MGPNSLMVVFGDPLGYELMPLRKLNVISINRAQHESVQ